MDPQLRAEQPDRARRTKPYQFSAVVQNGISSSSIPAEAGAGAGALD